MYETGTCVLPLSQTVKISRQMQHFRHLHPPLASRKQFISERDPEVVRKGNNDVSKQSRRPQRMLSVQKATYVKCIIACSV